MSYIQTDKRLKVPKYNLKAINLNEPIHQLETEMIDILQKQIFGISFSAYIDDQSPALKSKLTEKQIDDRMKVISPFTKWVRSFSCTDGNEIIPKVAKKYGLKTIVGAWLDDNKEQNDKEIEALIEVAKSGHADIVAVGNEVLLREDLSINELIGYIEKVKNALPNVEVGYVDAYYLFSDYPEIINVCDVILTNCYPFWEYCPLPVSIDYMKHMYQKTLAVAKGKKIIISETGWPDKGESLDVAVPSYENAISYFVNTYRWAKEDNIDIVYFSSFDEEWKIDDEGICGASWGLWDKYNQYKYGKDTNNEPKSV